MCAILDANSVSEVFGFNRPPAGKAFFNWLDKGSGHLVVGGKLGKELDRGSIGFRKWGQQARRSGRMKIENEGRVKVREEEIEAEGTCRSNDVHVLALAQVSGARLLYSNDEALQQDFTDKKLIDSPRGKVYSTLVNKNFVPSHKMLLARKDLCQI